MNYTENDLRRAFSVSSLAAGGVYRKQGRVLSIKLEDDQIISRVHGNERQPYGQVISFGETASGSIAISGNCSCPVGYNCKHVAAALLQGLERLSALKAALPAVDPHLGPLVAAARTPGFNQPPPTFAEAAPGPAALPYELAAWITRLEEAEQSGQEDYPEATQGRIFYVLDPASQSARQPKLEVKVLSGRLLKNGSLSASSNSFNLEKAFASGAPKYLRPADFRIFRAMRSLHVGYGWQTGATLASDAGAAVLKDILATGRARWHALDGPVLAQGEARPGTIVWQPAGGDALQPMIEIAGDLIVLQAEPPVYVDLAAGLLGPIDTGHTPRLAAALLGAPPVPLEHVQGLGASMAERLPRLASARPPLPRPAVIVEGPPIPVLKLIAADLPIDSVAHSAYYYNTEPPKERVGIARLHFRYTQVEIAHGETRLVLTRVRGSDLYEIHRDADSEKRALGKLLSHDLAPAPERRRNLPKAYALDFLPEGGDLGWFDFLYRGVSELRAAGFEIAISDDFPIRVLRGDGEVAADIGEGSGIDWLELGLGVMVDGERVDLIGPVVAIIERGLYDPATFEAQDGNDDPFYLPLGNGRFIALTPARFAPIINAIYELASGGALLGKSGALRLTRADAAGLGALETATEGSGLVWRGGEAIRAMGRKLTAAGGIPLVELPPAFTAALRPYQMQGVAWLAFLRDVGFGGILADDMGLGKTVQALALVAIEKAAGRLDVPALVVAPTSLMANWRREAEKFAPDLRVLTLQGSDRKDRFDLIPESDLVLTTYPLIGRDQEVLSGHSWHLLFLDEAQTIKNPDATTTHLIRALKARHRFCLTGTPLENHLGELWSLFAFVSPGFLGDRSGFTKLWRNPIEKKGNAERARLLAKRVKPFMLRRAKSEVASELPPKTEIMERVDMQAAQRTVYDSIRLSMHEKVRAAIADKGFARSRIVILDALLKLRQVCCDPRLLKLAGKASARAGSAKLERLEELLASLIGEGRKIIIFSQFTSMLDLIRPQLDKAGTPYALLTGQTRDREAEINRFRDTAVPVFLISLKAGGTGLNLTEADTVILYDPWWNPAVEEQAIDRAHRIGQNKPVFVHKLVVTGTIEEKMEVLKVKKRALAQSIFDSEGAPTLAMTEADLDMLFAEV